MQSVFYATGKLICSEQPPLMHIPSQIEPSTQGQIKLAKDMLI
jgi:hypothetical protein